jgi:hypothetical protein
LSSSFKIFAKYCASSTLKKVRFPAPGISVGNSGASPVAVAVPSDPSYWKAVGFGIPDRKH